MAAFHDELMKLIEPSLPMIYAIENMGDNSGSINELRLSDDLKDMPIAEVGKISYKSSGANVYIPKRIAKALRLNKEENRTFVILSMGDYGFFLIKDTELAKKLKLEILERRKGFNMHQII